MSTISFLYSEEVLEAIRDTFTNYHYQVYIQYSFVYNQQVISLESDDEEVLVYFALCHSDTQVEFSVKHRTVWKR
jgi:hypothetical protein